MPARTDGSIAVAGPNPDCVAAGAEVAADGGNAVDAAIAAIVAALVSEPGMASLGGGAFLTLSFPGRRAETIDGSVAMPGTGLPRSAFGRGVRSVSLAYGGGTEMGVGHGSVAVPGALTAFETAHQRYGAVPWERVIRPATRLARDGFAMGFAAAHWLSEAAGPIFGTDAAATASITGPDGSVLGVGQTVRMPDLADFLELLGREGSAALHRGEVAKALAADMLEHGGLVTEADLAGYRPVVRVALEARAGNWCWATNPPPSVGGSVLAAMLVLFESIRAADDTHRGTAIGPGQAGLERLIAVQRAVLSYRVRELDVAPDRVAAAEALMSAVVREGRRWLPSSPSTVHVSAVDGEGAACAVTASSGYGAGVSAPGTGVWLNSCLGERELNRRGLHALPVGERLVSNMSPTVGLHDDGSVLAIGSPGADRIASAVAQVVLGLIDGEDLQAAIDRPRVHVACAADGTPVRIEHEADAVRPPGLAADLPWREHPSRSMYFGGVAAAARRADGTLEAAADPRRAGAVIVSRPDL